MATKTKSKKPARKASAAQAKTHRKTASAAAQMGQVFYPSFGAGSNSQTMEKLMNNSKQHFEKFSTDAASLGKEQVEACTRAGSIFWKGCEDIMKTCMTYAQDSAEKQSQFMKKALGSKTLNEWTEVSNEIAQESFNDFMAGMTRISELGVKTCTDCLEPINDQFSKSMKKAAETAAA